MAGDALAYMADELARLSQWIDHHDVNEFKDPEALTWHRTTKVAEEAGEVVGAMVRYSNGNPRKPADADSLGALIDECLDTAIAALGAVEHLTHNEGQSMMLLEAKIRQVIRRAAKEF